MVFETKIETSFLTSQFVICHDKYLWIEDFNSETFETALSICALNLRDLYKLKNLVWEPTCFKNPQNPSCIDLLLNCSRRFQDT